MGAGPGKRVLRQLDNAGWRGPDNLVVPHGIGLVFQIDTAVRQGSRLPSR